MSLTAGTKLGPYEIVAPLGAGGMGEVYKARDCRLDRTVAIKILPPDMQASLDRRQRFEREAKAISSLQHPHICVLHDIGSENGVDYLVMEYLEGESLADRLHKGPLPTEQLLKLGIEIADALDKAHRQGLVHRDLKPGNVMLTKGGAKLLDFGLAKPSGLAIAATAAELDSATLTSSPQPVTARGVIVGTFQYMSPEQVQGQDADARSDIFALGALLYECATGQPAFTGKTQISLLSAILERQPESITVRNAASPPALEYVIRTCLQKEPDDRFQTAHDVSLQLKWIAGSTTTAAPVPGRVRRRRKWMSYAGWAVAVIATVAVIALLLTRHAPPTRVARFVITPGPRLSIPVDFGALALSRDGSKLAYIAGDGGMAHLYVRSLDKFDPIMIPESEAANFPFFSPDGRWISFAAHGKLMKAPADGSTTPSPVVDLPTFYGGSWTPDNHFLVTTMNTVLATVPVDGGPLSPLKAPPFRIDPGNPIALPDSDWVLFTNDKVASFSIYALNGKTGEAREVVPNAVQPIYAGGYLFYYSSGSIWAAPFDPKALKLTGSGIVIAQDVSARNWFSQYDVADDGTIAFAPGAGLGTAHNLLWVDRKGNATKIDVPPEDYVDPSIAPDGKHFVVCLRKLTEQALAVYDMDRGVMMRMSGNHKRSAAPLWSADSTQLFFDSSGEKNKMAIFRMPADASAAPVLVREVPSFGHVTSIAGGQASLMVNSPGTNYDLFTLQLDGSDMKPFRNSSAAERQGSYSPDGKFIAYSSDESGRGEVYVESTSGSGARWQVSIDGGEQPRWSRKSNEIFYRNGTKMMSVAVQMAPFSAAKPVQLFEGNYDRGGAVAGYDVTPDGQRFLMTLPERPNPTEIRVVLGWPEQLRKGASPAH